MRRAQQEKGPPSFTHRCSHQSAMGTAPALGARRHRLGHSSHPLVNQTGSGDGGQEAWSPAPRQKQLPWWPIRP